MKILLFIVLFIFSCNNEDNRVFRILVNENFDKTKPIDIPSNPPILIKVKNTGADKIVIGYTKNKALARAKEVPLVLKGGYLEKAEEHSIKGHSALIGRDTINLNQSFEYPLHFNYNIRNQTGYELYIFIYGEQRAAFSLNMDIDNKSYEAFILQRTDDGYLEYYEVTAIFKDKKLQPISFSKEDKKRYRMVSTKSIGLTFDDIKRYVRGEN